MTDDEIKALIKNTLEENNKLIENSLMHISQRLDTLEKLQNSLEDNEARQAILFILRLMAEQFNLSTIQEGHITPREKQIMKLQSQCSIDIVNLLDKK